MPVLQARSIRTRERLVAAARAALVELGLHNTPTAVVAQRAGVSHGTLFRHFPTKTDLLVAVVQAILADLVVGFGEELAAEPVRPERGRAKRARVEGPEPDRVTTACAALWRVFRRPEMRVVLEVYVAARTDASLAEGLEPVLDRHQATILTRARQLFPDAAAVNPELDDAVLAIVYAMQGAAVGLFCPDPEEEVAHLAFLERLARRELSRRPRSP
ncbi:MAG: TetR/AcrR family transcriptional regulator; helix-turn-helix transcriptional regulator [Deltaproteobacteria bacterium]|nr:TetR/AcrR family transcriptional regulator; helix-turn-helix transcriptional regulator [Kofleriaceae bacterium]